MTKGDDQAVPSTPADKFRSARGPIDDEVEEDLWAGGFSGKAMVGSWILAGVLTIVGVVAVAALAASNGTAWLALLIVVALIWLFMAGLLAYRKMSVRYELTTQRFIHKEGIFSRISNRIEVIDIDDVNFRQGFVERMFGVGTVHVMSSDRSHPELKMRGIDNVQEIADLIDDVRRQERRRRGVHIETI